MTKKLILLPSLALLLLSTEACYTQLAWFHAPEPEEQPLFDEYDPYNLSAIERASDFEPHLGSPYTGRRYGYDPFWSYYGNYGSPFSLYSPYYGYTGNPWLMPYGRTYYSYDMPGYGYGLTSPVIVLEDDAQTQRNWDRRGSGSSAASHLMIRREPPLASVTARPIKKELPIPKRHIILAQQRRWDVSKGQYDRTSDRGTVSSGTGWSSSSGTYSSGRSFNSGSSRSSSGARSGSSSGRVTRRR